MGYYSPLAFLTIAICIATAVVSYLAFRDSSLMDRLMFTPREILAEKQWYRLLSSALIHANWSHLGFNLLSFYLFAENIEMLYGAWILATIYVASVLGGSLLTLYIHRHHEYRSLGASGGICGVIFASVFLIPGSQVGMFFIPIAIPGWIYALVYLGTTFIAAKRGDISVAHFAHFGGCAIGLLSAFLISPEMCLAFPYQFFGAAALTVTCLVVFLIDPLGLQPMIHAKHRSGIRYQRYDDSRERGDRRAELDRLLDKVSEDGIDSLSAKDRRRLDELSRSSRSK